MSTELSSLLAQIYEAAVIPEKWPTVILSVAEHFDFWGGWFFATDHVHHEWIMSDNVKPAVMEFLSGGWAARDERLGRLLAAAPNGFFRDQDLFTETEINSMPLYQEFLFPRGFGFGAATIIETPGANRIVLALERRFEAGPADPQALAMLDIVRPHIARAIMLTSYTLSNNAQIAVEALDAVATPAAVLGADRKVIAINIGLEALKSQFKAGALGRMNLADRSANAQLIQAMSEVTTDSGSSVRSIAVPGRDAEPACVAHVIPFRGRSREIFTGSQALLVVSQQDRKVALNDAVLKGLYDLTPSEAALAKQLVAGRSLEEAASGLGVSKETVRSHLKNVFIKSGARSQTELVRRLSGLGTPNYV
ncbi:helix-turn-helix transcriptional regulator [Rhizobium sp. XQZ8]|uniref:helix-turn-helix transcriptional regulator n=1 Tax=Rhizobium populisoli TaxID=2859785 RepID=UPI001C682ECF|nr:helix-turn-helix transcriptional regulator [Rhizobium populisoli]MBW6425975.1 helix-turn-helix transcriptional regulator [Rhizobium populisoli]